MLILARHPDERVFLEVNGVFIMVMVASVMGDKVRLAFEAPQEVTIHREEVYWRIQAEKREGLR